MYVSHSKSFVTHVWVFVSKLEGVFSGFNGEIRFAVVFPGHGVALHFCNDGSVDDREVNRIRANHLFVF